jgi:hypothetical protein
VTTATEAKFIDINDLQLSDEVMDGFDPSANQYAPPAPIPPAIYLVRLGFAENDAAKRWFQLGYNKEKYPEKAARGAFYLKTRLVGVVTEGEFEKRRVIDPFVSTGIFDGSRTPGTSAVASLVHVLGRGDELRADIGQFELAQLFENCLATEPIVRVQTDWEATFSKEAGRKQTKGIKNFPTDAHGKPTHLLIDPVTNDRVAGYAVITRYFAN